MLFVTAQFALFLAALLLLLRVLPRRGWNGVLLAASLLFYGLWIPAYLPLLLVDIGVNYALLRRMLAAAPGTRARRGWLAASIVFTLALLLYFKYAAFLMDNAAPLVEAAVGVRFATPDILLPLGISFYSFQIISLAADAYASQGPAGDFRDELPIDGLARYALFVAFFPQLIAGPILRGAEFLPQLARGARPGRERTRQGLRLIASGVAKKVLLADFLLAPFVDPVFASAGVANRSFHWLAMYGFTFQIYFDFSGYTDMARGIAKLIGFELPENFEEPLLSRSPREFWTRWHVTLSRWLRLYLFLPISRALMRRGGPRWDRSAGGVALLVTMSLCGLWHGAGWPFVVWGAIHGVLLVVWRFPLGRDAGPIRARDLPAMVAFFHCFALSLVFFRCPDVAHALTYLQRLVVDNGLPGWPVLETGVVAICGALHVSERWLRVHGDAIAEALAASAAGAYGEALLFGLVAGAAVLASGAGGEFIYFQF